MFIQHQTDKIQLSPESQDNTNPETINLINHHLHYCSPNMKHVSKWFSTVTFFKRKRKNARGRKAHPRGNRSLNCLFGFFFQYIPPVLNTLNKSCISVSSLQGQTHFCHWFWHSHLQLAHRMLHCVLGAWKHFGALIPLFLSPKCYSQPDSCVSLEQQKHTSTILVWFHLWGSPLKVIFFPASQYEWQDIPWDVLREKKW